MLKVNINVIIKETQIIVTLEKIKINLKYVACIGS